MFRFSQSPVSRRASAPFQNIPVQQPQPGMPMQMAAPALPAIVNAEKAEPSVYQGINGLLDMQEMKDGVGWFKDLFPSEEEQHANEFMGLLGGYPGGGQMHANEFAGLMGGSDPASFMAMGVPSGGFESLTGLLGSWF